jgi:hypothetical protein
MGFYGRSGRVSAQVSARTFDRPIDFDLEKYADDGKFGFGEGERVRITCLIDRWAGLHLLESPLSSDQDVREVGDNEYEISATVVDSAVLGRWLLSFGTDVRNIRKEPFSDSGCL